MKIVTYIKPKCNNGGINIDTSNLATKQELKDGVQEAKDYADACIKNITNSFDTNVIFETVEG